MGKSRRKNPVIGICGARSEKFDKRKWHRRFRRANRMIDTDQEIMPHFREHSNPWDFAKDGKQRLRKGISPLMMSLIMSGVLEHDFSNLLKRELEEWKRKRRKFLAK